MSNISAEKLNALFTEAVTRGNADQLTKVAETTGLFIQRRLRENSFTQKILPPQTVTVAELDRSPDDEGFQYIDDIEGDSMAMTVNMRGEPEKVWFQSPRYVIKFFTITSPEFVKDELELQTYRMPIVKVIEQNTVKDLQEQVDKQFMTHVKIGLMYATIARKNTLVGRGVVKDNVNDANAAFLGTSAQRNFRGPLSLASYLFTRNVGDTTVGGALGATPAVWDAVFAAAGPADARYALAEGVHSNIILSSESRFTRFVLRDLMKVMPNRELKGRVFLIHESDWVDTLAWLESEAGLRITEEIVVEGYKYATVGGYTFVTTVRDNPDILSPGQIFAFPAPEFLGRYMILENTKFFIDRRARTFHMQAWHTCGIGLGNMKGLALVLLQGARISLPNVFDTNADVAMATGGRGGTFTLVNDYRAPIV